MVAAARPLRCVAMSAFKASVRTSGASPGNTSANFERPSVRLATCRAWPVPFCGCCKTVVAPSGSTTLATWSAWCPTTTTVSRALSGSHAPRICSTRVRPPARCNTFARLDLRRVPFPAARTITARSWLDIPSSPFCGSRGFLAIRGLPGTAVERLVAGSRGGLGEDGMVGWLPGLDRFARSDGPEGGVGKQSADELRMQGVTRFMGLDPGQQRQASQGQITDQVQRLVTTELVGKAQRAIHDAVVSKDNGVFERSTADEAHAAQRLDVPLEAERPRPRQQMAESVGANDHFHFLLADQRVREIHVAADAKLLGWINTDPSVAFTDFERLQNLQITALTAQLAQARLLEHLHERLGRAIEDGHFDRIDVDVYVVDATGINGGKEMLGGGQQHSLLHQAGGVADSSNVLTLGLDREVVEINAAENDAGLGGCGHQADATVDAGVQAHTLGRRFSSYGCLEHSPQSSVAFCGPGCTWIALYYQRLTALLPIFGTLAVVIKQRSSV